MFSNEKPLRMAILQRVCTGYRIPVFSKLTNAPDIESILIIGEDIPNSKVKSSPNLEGINYRKLKTRFIKLGNRILPWHVGLIDELRKINPDVILCEGESNFLSYLKALWYCRRHKGVAAIHWSLGGLPGVQVRPRTLASRFKYSVQKHFDAFLVYSSFGKQCLMELGHPEDNIFVATNVADSCKHLSAAEKMTETPSKARARLGLPDRFTVLYAGAMDANKRPDILLDLAKESNPEHYNFVLLGEGAMLEELRERAKSEGLNNVSLPGRVSETLPLYYRASDVMVLPGRGGMVISEAMAWSLPVIVHQADGTEYDLVQNEVTGLHLQSGNVNDFRKAIEFLRDNPCQCAIKGIKSRQIIENQFNTKNMVDQIIRAAQYAKNARNIQ